MGLVGNRAAVRAQREGWPDTDEPGGYSGSVLNQCKTCILTQRPPHFAPLWYFSKLQPGMFPPPPISGYFSFNDIGTTFCFSPCDKKQHLKTN